MNESAPHLWQTLFSQRVLHRDMVDIPEVFRRAFDEEEDWGNGDEDDGGGNGSGRGRSWWRNRWLWLAAIVLILFLSFNWIIGAYTDWLWFGSLNLQSVWLTQWLVRVIVFAIGFIISMAVLLGNWRLAISGARKSRSPFSPAILDLPQIRWLVNGLAILIAIFFAGAAGTQWEQILLFFNRQPFGLEDPVFELDVGFFVFELPFYSFIQGWFTPLLLITSLGVVAIYLVENRPDFQERRWRPSFSPTMRRHVAGLATVTFQLWAAG